MELRWGAGRGWPDFLSAGSFFGGPKRREGEREDQNRGTNLSSSTSTRNRHNGAEKERTKIPLSGSHREKSLKFLCSLEASLEVGASRRTTPEGGLGRGRRKDKWAGFGGGRGVINTTSKG